MCVFVRVRKHIKRVHLTMTDKPGNHMYCVFGDDVECPNCRATWRNRSPTVFCPGPLMEGWAGHACSYSMSNTLQDRHDKESKNKYNQFKLNVYIFIHSGIQLDFYWYKIHLIIKVQDLKFSVKVIIQYKIAQWQSASTNIHCTLYSHFKM